CVNFTDHMKNRYELYVFTRDRDLDDSMPYEDVKTNVWTEDKNVYIFYASPQYLRWKNILHEIRMINPEFVYLNSMYSFYFTIYPLLMRRSGKILAKTILAPRGMLQDGAMGFKKFKKILFLRAL